MAWMRTRRRRAKRRRFLPWQQLLKVRRLWKRPTVIKDDDDDSHNVQTEKESSRSLNLLDLPVDLIRSIVEWSAPKNPNERWHWLSSTGGTCRIFRLLARELTPTEFIMKEAFKHRTGGGKQHRQQHKHTDRVVPRLRAPLLRSFLDAPWKGANLTTLAVDSSCLLSRFGIVSWPIKHALRTVLATSGVFPNLKGLLMKFDWRNKISVIDIKMLNDIAQNLPKLTSLELYGGFRRVKVTPEQFGAFGESLQQSLRVFSLKCVPWMTDDHIQEFLRRHPGSVTMRRLRLIHCRNFFTDRSSPVRLSDLTAQTISSRSGKLESIWLAGTEITSNGLSSILRSNGDACTVSISYCHHLGPGSVDALVEHTPKLQVLYVGYCSWFTDDCLNRLVHGRMDYSRSGKRVVPMLNLDITETSVTPNGLRRALKQAPGVLGLRGKIYIGRSREELFSEKVELAGLPRLNRFLEQWRALARDFPDIHFAGNRIRPS